MILQTTAWQAQMRKHEESADEFLARYRHPGSYHPVYDFLFEYYPVRPSHLRRWHPGVGITLEGDAPHSEWRYYRNTSEGVTLDTEAFLERRGGTVRYILDLLEKTTCNPTQFDCFGLHEWAMVYHTDTPRHDLPLRLGAEGTNEVVDKHRVKCTHYDAFRFFTEPARPLNLTVLNREDQPENDQAGCVHVSMDLYKWAWKLGPLVPGELFLDTFRLAVAARTLDMEASPYDCREWGFGVVPIETSEGKSEYVRRQRALADASEPLRARLVSQIRATLAATMRNH